MPQLVDIHKKQKKKYSISKDSHKFGNQFHLTLKEIDIRNKAKEAAKNKERS